MRVMHTGLVAVVGAVALGCSDVTTPSSPAVAKPASVEQALSALGSIGIGRSAVPLAMVSEYVQTPAGEYHKSCVHELPEHAVAAAAGLIRRADGSEYQIPACSYPVYSRGRTSAARITPPTVSGWLEYGSTWADPNVCSSGSCGAGAYSRIAATGSVPSSPFPGYSTAGKVYYTFPGLEPADGSNILQPVLQYGNNGSYGGAYWTMAAWTCGPICLHSTPVAVYPGDVIQTTINGYAGAGCGTGSNCWSIDMLNTSRTGRTTGVWTDSRVYRWAVGGVVEVYNLDACSDFPSYPTSWYNVTAEQFASPGSGWVAIPTLGSTTQDATWSAQVNSASPSCNYHVDTYTDHTTWPYNGGVTLYHNSF